MKFSDLPLHHAVLITHTDRAAYSETLWRELSSLSPAHRYFNQTVLDIETARDLITWAQSSYNGERVALVSFHTASLPAQNALLKVLEEPRDGTRFILLTTSASNLIPTVQSRTQHVRGLDTSTDITKGHVREFLSTSPVYRMKLSFILELLNKEDEEGRKDREAVKSFILCVAECVALKNAEARYVTETLELASYASDPSSSGKALLEYLSLLLPEFA